MPWNDGRIEWVQAEAARLAEIEEESQERLQADRDFRASLHTAENYIADYSKSAKDLGSQRFGRLTRSKSWPLYEGDVPVEYPNLGA